MKLLPDLTTFTKRVNASPKDNIHSLELVLTVVVFVLIGRFLDNKFDTGFLYTIIFIFVGAIGSLASAYYRYMEISKRQDADKVYTRNTTKKSIQIPTEDDEKLIVPKGYGQDDE